MIRIAYCDDDPLMLQELSQLLEQYRILRSCPMEYRAFDSPFELMASIEGGKYWDILLLDILMPGENGITLAKEIRNHDENVKLIFLTSSAEFAVASYTVEATFYQLKPITAENLFPILDKAIGQYQKEISHNLIIKCKNGLTSFAPDQLEYCEVIGRSLTLHMKNGTVLESIGTMDELTKKLSPIGGFLRVHRSYLINMAYVQSVSYRAVTLLSQTEIPIPRGKYGDIKQTYLSYAFEKEQVYL